jgi:hypothetical protein
MNVSSLRHPSFIEASNDAPKISSPETAVTGAHASYMPERPFPVDGIDGDTTPLVDRFRRLPSHDPRLARGEDGVGFGSTHPQTRVLDGLEATTTEVPQSNGASDEDPQILYNAIVAEALKNLAWNIILEPVVKAVTTVGNNMIQGAYDPNRTPPPPGTKQPTQGANGNNGAGGAGGMGGSNPGTGGAGGSSGAGGAPGAAK